MFLMFRLGRPNILPDLDLGVQKGIQHAYRLPKLPTPKDVLRIGERWAPYASVASWYMWRLLELPEVIRREAKSRSAARTKEPAPASAPRTPAKTPGTSATKAGSRSAKPRPTAKRKTASRKTARKTASSKAAGTRSRGVKPKARAKRSAGR